MSYVTLADIRRKIQVDTDTEAETFVQPSELIAYINDAIRDAESEIHAMYEDYLLTRQTITLVNGQEAYDLPTNIYAMKIRGIMYNNGNGRVFEVKKIKDWYKFRTYTLNTIEPTTNPDYQYFLENSTPGSPKFLLSPLSTEAGPYLTLWYLREANKLAVDTDICDIPEFLNFIYAHVKVAIASKEKGDPMMQKLLQDLADERQKMNATLANITPDFSNEIQPDLRLYDEMS